METNKALEALSALAHDMRLEAFRLLVRAGKDGISAGDLARCLDARPNTLSANLSILLQSGLIGNRREGRSIVYHAELDAIRALLGFLVEDCCGGHPDVCAPLLDEIACAC
jgi:DNA-binding transcriptional ArsR family regulator